MRKSIGLVLFCALFIATIANAQFQSFQKEYKTKAFTLCFDIAPTPDGGYVYSGTEQNMPDPGVAVTPYITKVDCNGEPEWTKRFSATSTLINIDHEVAVFPNNEYVLCSSRGFNGARDIMLVKLDADGNTVWRQFYGGSGDDLQGGVVAMSNGNICVVGSTNSFGINQGSNFSDMYVLMINGADGQVLWTKTYGLNGAFSRAFDVIETDNGGVALTGTTFHAPSVGNWAPLIRLDAFGNVEDIRFYGLSDRQTQALSLERAKDGGYLLSGSSNILGADWFDTLLFPFVIKTDSTGNLEWGSVIEGTPNLTGLGGIAYSPVDNGDTIGVAIETYFYSSLDPMAVDPTKRLLALLSEADGSLFDIRQYNLEGGQFPKLTYDNDGGYIMSAFTDENNGSGPNDQFWVGPIINKLDNQFASGCNETDRTPETILHNPAFEVNTTITFNIDSGVNLLTPDPAADSFSVALPVVETFCEQKHMVEASFTYPFLSCADLSVFFEASVSYPVYELEWDFGDGTIVNTGMSDTITHTYQSAGSYFCNLNIILCDTILQRTDTLVLNDRVPDATIDSIPPFCPMDMPDTLSAAEPGGVWTGEGIVDSIVGIFDPMSVNSGTYEVIYTIREGVCLAADTIAVEVLTEEDCECRVFMPNVFTPNGDNTNDTFGPVINEYCMLGEVTLMVYNRWGDDVFISTTLDDRWDGTVNGSEAPSDVYIFVFDYIDEEGVSQQMVGDVTLLR